MPPRKKSNNRQAHNVPNIGQLDAATTETDAPAPSLPLPSKSRPAQSKSKPTTGKAPTKPKPTKAKAPTKLTGIAMFFPSTGHWYNANGRCPAPPVDGNERTWIGGSQSLEPPPETDHSSIESPQNSVDSAVLFGDINDLDGSASLSSEPNKGSEASDTCGSAYTLPHDYDLGHPLQTQAAPKVMEYEALPAPDYVPPGSGLGNSAFGLMTARTDQSKGDNVTAPAAPSIASELPPPIYPPHHPSNAVRRDMDAVPQYAGPHYGQPSQHDSGTTSHYLSMSQQGWTQDQFYQHPVRYTTAASAFPPSATNPAHKRKRRDSFSEAGETRTLQSHDEAKKAKLSLPWNDESDFRSINIFYDSEHPLSTMPHHISTGQPVYQHPVQYNIPASALPPPPTIPAFTRKRRDSFSEVGETQPESPDEEAQKVDLSLPWDDDSDFSSNVFDDVLPFAHCPDEVEASTPCHGSLLAELLDDDSEGYLSGPSTSESSFGVDTPEPESEPDDDAQELAPKQKEIELDSDFETDDWFGNEAPKVFDWDDFDGL